MSKKIVPAVFIQMLCNILLFCQADSAYILPELRIYQKTNNEISQYNFDQYKHNKFSVNDSLLIANPLIYNYKVKLDEIKRISIHNGTHFWGAAKVTGVTGFVLGFVFWGFFEPPPIEPSSTTKKTEFKIGGAIIGGLMTAVSFGLVGGLVGLLSPYYDDYDIYKVRNELKSAYIKKIFYKNRIRKK
jgi:hypothetical protein